MKNKLYKIFIILALIFVNVCPAFTVTENSRNIEQTQASQNQITTVDVVQQDKTSVAEEPTITEQVQADVDNSVRIPSKSEIKHVLGKFLKTMLLVLGSCIIIYFALLGYKKFKSPTSLNNNDVDVKKNLNSPKTIEEATKFFIEKF